MRGRWAGCAALRWMFPPILASGFASLVLFHFAVSSFTKGDSGRLLQWRRSPALLKPGTFTRLQPVGLFCHFHHMTHSTTCTYTCIIRRALTLLGAIPTYCTFPPITPGKVVFPFMAVSSRAPLASLQPADWQPNSFSVFAWWGWCWLSLSVKQPPHFHCTVPRYSALHPHPAPQGATTVLHPAQAVN